MDFEACREAVYSEEWYDFMLRKDDPLPEEGDDTCLMDMDGGYQSWYYKPVNLPPLNFRTYSYKAVPKCFTPLSAQALDASGILPIRNQPNLSLTGEGVLIGIVDTGERVILLHGRGKPCKPEGFG